MYIYDYVYIYISSDTSWQVGHVIEPVRSKPPRFPGLFLRRHFPGHHRRCRGATGFHAEQMNGLSYEDSYYEHIVHIICYNIYVHITVICSY